jgi:hypothetical protein
MWHILCVNCPPDVKTNDCFVYDKRRDGVYVCVLCMCVCVHVQLTFS